MNTPLVVFVVLVGISVLLWTGILIEILFILKYREWHNKAYDTFPHVQFPKTQRIMCKTMGRYEGGIHILAFLFSLHPPYYQDFHWNISHQDSGYCGPWRRLLPSYWSNLGTSHHVYLLALISVIGLLSIFRKLSKRFPYFCKEAPIGYVLTFSNFLVLNKSPNTELDIVIINVYIVTHIKIIGFVNVFAGEMSIVWKDNSCGANKPLYRCPQFFHVFHHYRRFVSRHLVSVCRMAVSAWWVHQCLYFAAVVIIFEWLSMCVLMRELTHLGVSIEHDFPRLLPKTRFFALT